MATTHTNPRPPRRNAWMRWLIVGGAVVAAAAATLFVLAQRSRRTEVIRLAELLSLREGMTVADVGAGTGWLSVEVARRVGPSGRVYATEVSVDRLEDIRRAAAAAGLSNLIIVEAGERTTGLAPGCCDAIFMRRVYHHLTAPADIMASISQALRPGGRLAIIEFGPGGLIGTVTGMGVEPDDVIRTAAANGLEVITTDEWPGWDLPGEEHYVVVFEKAR